MSPGDATVLYRALPKQLRFSAEEKRALRTFARTLAKRVPGVRGFSCLISDDRELRRLNRQFLNRDYAADVLSFPAREQNGESPEIAISVERAEAQALEFGHSRVAEICILMLHGLLHLSGMSHEDDHGEMAHAEDEWRKELGLPATLIARVSSPRANR